MLEHSRGQRHSRGQLLAVLAGLLLGGLAQADTLPASGGDIEITPQLHASVQLVHQGRVIQIDPWGAAGLDNYRDADLILITDNPGHHLDPGAISRLRTSDTVIVAPANSSDSLPGARIMEIGERLQLDGIGIEAIAAYDLTPGAPEHPRGDALGYVLEMGGRRLFFAGVSECVEEIRALTDIDVAFLPMNIPPERMGPEDAAACARHLSPERVYVYHYDQARARRLAAGDTSPAAAVDAQRVESSLDRFAALLAETDIEFRRGDWYPGSRLPVPRFELDRDWPALPLGERWLTGGLGGLCIDGQDHLYLLNRQNVVAADLDAARLAPPIIELNPAGEVVGGWGDPEELGGRLHDCHAHGEGLWIVAAATGQLLQFSHDGERLLQRIGERDRFDSSDGSRAGRPLNSDRARFFLPAAIDIDAATGELYVADGELPGGNRRIAVLDRDGEFLRQWFLHREDGDDSIELPHCLRLSRDDLVYVCDRRGDRIQVFDRQGELIRQIELSFSPLTEPEGRDSGERGNAVVLAFSADPEQRYLYVVNQNAVAVDILDRRSGELLGRLGDGPGRYPGQFELPHGIAVDSNGNIYIAEQEGRRVQRFNYQGEEQR